jgi:putative inorganic carbon (HCO3(-)) transporter
MPSSLGFMLVGFGGLGTTSIAVYALAICVIPLAIFWRPVLAVYLLVPLMPLQTLRYQFQVLPFGDKFVDALLLAAILGLLIHRTETRIIPHTRLNRFLFLYCAFLFVMLWYGSFLLHLPLPISPSDDRVADWKNFVEMPILFLVVVSVMRTRKQMLTLLSLMMLTLLRANLGFYHTVSGRDFSHFSNNLRYAGVLGYAGQNGLAAFMAEFLIFLLAIAPAAKGLWHRVLVYASILLSAYCVLFCFSRGGYVGALGGLVVLGLMKDRKYLVLVGILLATWQTLVPSAVRERVLMTYEDGQVESSANERLQLWEDAFTIIPQHPILGTGFVTYRHLGRSADYSDTHNLYVKVTVEGGFVGLALFLYLLWIITREGIALFRKSKDPFFERLGLGLTAMMACSVLVNLFGDRWMYQQITAYMWTYLALVYSAGKMNDQAETIEVASSMPVTEFQGSVA